MSTYTSLIQKPLETISWDDENFIEELLGVAQLFRPFSEAITAFMKDHGYSGSQTDIDAKVSYLRSVFRNAHMDAPREIREWFTAGQPIKRDTAYQICFAFGLDGSETDEFFRCYYARERSFNCHQLQEAIYYFCLNNGLSYAEALEIQMHLPPADETPKDGEVVYTGTIIAELNGLTSKEELIAYLSDNIDKFSSGNVTAYAMIQRLWEKATAPDGLLVRERQTLPSLLDDYVSGKKDSIRSTDTGVKPWDAYLAIFQLDKKEVQRLETDRSLKPLLDQFHENMQDSFPDRQGIDLILRGKHVSYERVRKWLILLTFYTFWARKALDRKAYEAGCEDAARCITHINQVLLDAGYPELYVGNPYDWIFFYAIKSDEPLTVFRSIWNELLTRKLEEHR